jgi:hypothetical protein
MITLRFLRWLADNESHGSFASKLRRRRLELFRSLIADLPWPIKILDVGGTQRFWDIADWTDEGEVEVTILNVDESKVTRPNFSA